MSLLSWLRKEEKAAHDVLVEAVAHSHDAVTWLVDTVDQLEHSNGVLGSVVKEAEAQVAKWTKRGHTAAAQATANSNIAAKLNNLIDPATDAHAVSHADAAAAAPGTPAPPVGG